MKGIGVGSMAGLTGVAGSSAATSERSANSRRQETTDRLQGQVPIEDQESGRSQEPYAENVELVGENDVENRGMNGNLGWIGDTAYVSAYFGADDPLAGLAVIDASDPENPELVEVKEGTPGTRESQVKASGESGLVVVMPWESQTSFGDEPSANLLQIYEVVDGDPNNIEHVTDHDFGDYVPHEHQFSPDGTLVYVAGYEQPPLRVIDVSDPANPTELLTWSLEEAEDMDVEEGSHSLHDLFVRPDGTRAYLNSWGWTQGDTDFTGLTIIDTTELAEGASDPSVSHVSTVRWGPPELIGGSHSAHFATIQGREYVIAMDETFDREGCPWGWARIIDVTEEAHPLQISTIRLDVSKRRNCDVTTRDGAMYSSHYLGVDDVADTSMVFFTWYSSGLRVFDVRDPYDPTEIGYYIAGANTDPQHPVREEFGNTNIDYAYSWVRYRPENGHIWFNNVHNGFQIVRLEEEPGESEPTGTTTTQETTEQGS